MGPWGGVGGWNSNSFPLAWGEGFLFSVPAVFLLFNLNTQPLHHSCIPECGRGLCWQLEPQDDWGNFISMFTSESSPFSVQLERRLSRASRCFWVWTEQTYIDRGAYVPSGTSSPSSSSARQRVKCNDLFKSKPIPPTPVWGSTKHCLPPALDHKLNLRGKALG